MALSARSKIEERSGGVKPEVEAWIDGGCDPNPGFGAWAAVLVCNGTTKEITGTEKDSTNQRAELLAAIGALTALKTPCRVKIMSDSQYLVGTMTSGWRRRANLDLWDALDAASEGHDVEWVKVKAHQGGNLRPHALTMMVLKRREAA
jgi:ribonuclease HI